MTDEELAAKAMAAKKRLEYLDLPWDGSLDDGPGDIQAFIAAADPDAVLDLIAKHDALVAEVRRLRALVLQRGGTWERTT